jgi:hypothetical protein
MKERKEGTGVDKKEQKLNKDEELKQLREQVKDLQKANSQLRDYIDTTFCKGTTVAKTTTGTTTGTSTTTGTVSRATVGDRFCTMMFFAMSLVQSINNFLIVHCPRNTELRCTMYGSMLRILFERGLGINTNTPSDVDLTLTTDPSLQSFAKRMLELLVEQLQLLLKLTQQGLTIAVVQIGDYRLTSIKYSVGYDDTFVGEKQRRAKLCWTNVHCASDLIWVDLSDCPMNKRCATTDILQNDIHMVGSAIQFPSDPMQILHTLMTRTAEAGGIFSGPEIDSERIGGDGIKIMQLIDHVQRRLPKIISAGFAMHGKDADDRILDCKMETKDSCPITGTNPPFACMRVNCKCTKSENGTEYLSVQAIAGIIATSDSLFKCPNCRSVFTEPLYLPKPKPQTAEIQTCPMYLKQIIRDDEPDTKSSPEEDQSDAMQMLQDAFCKYDARMGLRGGGRGRGRGGGRGRGRGRGRGGGRGGDARVPTREDTEQIQEDAELAQSLEQAIMS